MNARRSSSATRVANSSSNWSTASTSRSPDGTCSSDLRRSSGGSLAGRTSAYSPSERRQQTCAEERRLAATRRPDDREQRRVLTSRADELVDEPLAAEEELGVRRLERREPLERADVAQLAVRSRARSPLERGFSAGSWTRIARSSSCSSTPGLEPELVGQERPRLPVDLEPLGLTTRPIEGEHQLRAEALAVRDARRRAPRARRRAQAGGRARAPHRSAPRRPRAAAPRAARPRHARTARTRDRRAAVLATATPRPGRTRPHAAASPPASASRPAPTRRSKCSRSSSPARRAAGSRERARRAGARPAPPAPSTFRSRETWLRSAWSAEFTLCSAKSSPISRSRATTRFALRSSSASSARCFGPPSGDRASVDRTRRAGRESGTRGGSLAIRLAESPSSRRRRCQGPETPLGQALGHRRRDASRDALHGEVLLARRDRGRASARRRIGPPKRTPRTPTFRGASTFPATNSCSASSSRAVARQREAGERAARHAVRARHRLRLGRSQRHRLPEPTERRQLMRTFMTAIVTISTVVLRGRRRRSEHSRRVDLRRQRNRLLRDDPGCRRRGAATATPSPFDRDVRRRHRHRQEHHLKGAGVGGDRDQRRRARPHDRRRRCRGRANGLDRAASRSGRRQHSATRRSRSAAESSSRARRAAARGATVTITDSVITGNRATPTVAAPVGPPCPGGPCGFARGDGGGIWNAGDLTLLRTTVSENEAGGPVASDAHGGGIWSAGVGTLTLRNCTVSGNRSAVVPPNGRFAIGGGVHIQDGGGLAITTASSPATPPASAACCPAGSSMLANGGGIHVGDDSTSRSTTPESTATRSSSTTPTVSRRASTPG